MCRFLNKSNFSVKNPEKINLGICLGRSFNFFLFISNDFELKLKNK